MSASLFVSNVPLRKPTTPPFSPDFLRTGDAKSESNGHLTEFPVSWCNYCSQQANFRCVRCRDAFYCSVHCQTQDWTAHRHTCTASSPISSVIKYPTESQGSAVMGKTVTTLQPKLNVSDDSTAQPTMSHQKTYLKDLKPNSITKGTEMKGLVAEFSSPSRFFVQFHDPQVTENLKSITTELTKAASDGLPSTSYTPSQGEVCAVKLALDGNWYRGLVQSVSANQKPATVLYIDIGNEETVADGLFLIKPLPVSLQVMPPCVLQCRLSGVVPVAGSWTRECCMAMKLLLISKYFPVIVIDSSENGHVFTVDIQLSAFGKRLSTFLIDQGYAAPATVTKKTEPDINSLVSASLDNFKRLSIGKDENLGARPPKPLTLCVGDTFSAMITNLQSPHNMICQKFENAAAIHEHQCMLREHCSQIPANHNFRPAPGTMCCSHFSEDKQWYRAKVLAYSSEEHVCVGYIDFGPSEEVELSRLRPISRALLALPLQAIPCALAGVGPVEECWSEDCIALLRQAVCNRQLHVKILGKRDGTALVSMMDEFGDPQADIAELLLTLGHACPQQLDADSQTHNGDSLVEEIWADTQFVSCAASPEVPPPIWCYSEFPSDGQMVAVVANLVENPGDFYCYLHNPEDPHKMQNLMADLKQHCEADNAPFRPRVGEPCCAMFSGDGVWYRAMAQSVFEEKAEVLFVDYGNSSQVEISHLRTIPPKLLALPIQTIHCCLKGMSRHTQEYLGMLPVGSAWSSETISRFQTLMGKSDLKVRVTSKVGDVYEVELESRGQSVTSTLQLEEQLATNAATRQENCSSSVSEAPETYVTRETSQDLVPPITKDAAPPLVPPITKDAAPPLVPPITKDAAPPLVPPITKDAAPPLVPPITKDAAPPLAVTLPPDVPAGGFPVDWRAGELPQNETFQPRVAAIISPSLFYLYTTKMGVEELQKMMMDLEVYGSTNQDFCLSQTPAVGAACCARSSGSRLCLRFFHSEVENGPCYIRSGDKNWYRAVVLEAGESEVTVLYADHGNSETLPYTSILPIPSHLLKVPFYITRCALTGSYEGAAIYFLDDIPGQGKKLLPLPAEELALFKTLLSEDVSAVVDYSDNLIHLLSVTLPAHRGGGRLNTLTLNRLQPQTTTPPRTDQALQPQHTDASASGASQMPSATPVELEQPTGNTDGTADATRTMPDAAVVNDNAAQKVADQITALHSPHTQSNGVEKQQEVCCCVEMKTKMAHLEQMLELLLTRMEK